MALKHSNRRKSRINFYLQAKFHKNQITFLWTDGRMYTHIRTFETHIIRSTQKSQPKM